MVADFASVDRGLQPTPGSIMCDVLMAFRLNLLVVVVVSAAVFETCAKHPALTQSDERRAITNVGDVRSPVMSRDGAAVAFAAVGAGYTTPQIWIGRADGSAPARPLTNDAFQ